MDVKNEKIGKGHQRPRRYAGPVDNEQDSAVGGGWLHELRRLLAIESGNLPSRQTQHGA